MMCRSIRFRLGVVAGFIAAWMVAPSALAHHSVTAYDLNAIKDLSGTVTEFQWTNPHSWIQLLVTDEAGKQTEWAIECGTPNFNAAQGWKKSDLRSGDKVEVRVHPMRDGSAHGTLVDVKLADGRVLLGPTTVIGSGSAAEK